MMLRIMSTAMPEISRPSTVERRQHFRAKLMPNFVLTVRVWKIEPRLSLRVKPMPSQELRVLMTELSVGGMSVTIPSAMAQPLTADATDRLRIELKYSDGELLLEGRLRTTETGHTADGSIRTGIAFRKGNGQLGSIVNALQRAELRLLRGIDAPPAQKAG
jgi:hypothetical protein